MLGAMAVPVAGRRLSGQGQRAELRRAGGDAIAKVELHLGVERDKVSQSCVLTGAWHDSKQLSHVLWLEGAQTA